MVFFSFRLIQPCSFTGSAGQAVISRTAAYLITDSRYWLQAQMEVDKEHWRVVPAGDTGGPKDWIEWLIVRSTSLFLVGALTSLTDSQDRAKDSRIGIDGRMIAHEKAVLFSSKLTSLSSKLIFPPQNFIDLLWKDKPQRSKDPIALQPRQFTGRDARDKLDEVKAWVKAQPPATLSYSKAPATPAQMHVGTLITSLDCIGTELFRPRVRLHLALFFFFP
jgi:Xaa-Pro aminopeptidase